MTNPQQPSPKITSQNILWHHGDISQSDRRIATHQSGTTVWFTGLSGSGKSTIAVELERMLIQAKHNAYRLDGDNVRHGLNSDLGFSAQDRTENIRRIGEVARLFADAGVICLASFVSPYRTDRDLARAKHDQADLPFFEVFVDTPIEVCESRDPKGLYKKARAGKLKGFTGIDDPYEPPTAPELILDTTKHDITACAQLVLDMLYTKDILPGLQ